MHGELRSHCGASQVNKENIINIPLMTENVMVGWHHRLDGHEFEQASGVGDGTGKPGVLQSLESQRVRHD